MCVCVCVCVCVCDRTGAKVVWANVRGSYQCQEDTG